MKLVVISPEADDPREPAILRDLFAAGLERYHIRKPGWSREKLAAWLHAFPPDCRSRLVLHQHHELVETLDLGGVHFRDTGTAAVPGRISSERPRTAAVPSPITSRSCHDLPSLRAALGHYDSVFFSPVFPSLSKPGHAPRPDVSLDELSSLLVNRTASERRTTVLALGGITVETAPRALALGFDGVAVLGAIWQAADPVRAFSELREVAPASCRPSVPNTGWKPALLPTPHAA